MGHPIAEHFDSPSTANELAIVRAELRNANARADKLQDEMANTRRANELLSEAAKRWQARGECAESTIDAMLEILRPHAVKAVGEAGTPLDVVHHIASRLTTDPEPDIDTVPLADLLDAVQTFLPENVRLTLTGRARFITINGLNNVFHVSSETTHETLTHISALEANLEIPF